MPCTSNYPDPTSRNRLLQSTAARLVYVNTALKRIVTPKMREAAKNVYCTSDYVETLCTLLTHLQKNDEPLFDKIVYDARSADARKLATWWEKHQRADAERIKREAADNAREVLIRSAMAKLTPEEIAAITHK
jgi:hypothetical protein